MFAEDNNTKITVPILCQWVACFSYLLARCWSGGGPACELHNAFYILRLLPSKCSST